MSRPAMGMLLMLEPMTYPSATGITWVTPSPESTTQPCSRRRMKMKMRRTRRRIKEEEEEK